MAGRTDPRERRRYPAWCFRIVSKSGAALLELSRPNEGPCGDSVPPDVRFCRETCVDGSSALVDRLNRAAVT
jgi:hypothetical protein